MSQLVNKMGEYLTEALEMTEKALVMRDVSLAKETMLLDEAIDEIEKDIETLCLHLLMRHQPVASDLRFISAALKIITDMERIGDHAEDISENITYMAKDDYTPHLADMLKMAKITAQMVRDSVKAFIKKDLKLAQQVLSKDDEVDALFLKIKLDLIEKMRRDASIGEQALDLMMNAKYYERIGDHAENIAEWVVYSITAKHVE
jgi:phosphate transport system protein